MYVHVSLLKAIQYQLVRIILLNIFTFHEVLQIIYQYDTCSIYTSLLDDISTNVFIHFLYSYMFQFFLQNLFLQLLEKSVKMKY